MGLEFHFCPTGGHPRATCWGFLSRYVLRLEDGRAEMNGADLLQLWPSWLSSPHILVTHFHFLKDSWGDKRTCFLSPVRIGLCQLQVREQSLHFNLANSAGLLFHQASRCVLGTGWCWPQEVTFQWQRQMR